MAGKRKPGQAPKYNTPEEMQERIDAYFTDCAGEWLRDENGRFKMDKQGRPIKVDERPPTISGLTMALGFSTRKSLWDYQHKTAFSDTVTVAKSRIEAYMEARLFDRDGYAGAKFALITQFGWGREPQVEKWLPPAGVQIIQRPGLHTAQGNNLLKAPSL